MKLRKEVNKQGGGGYVIYLKVGSREFKSWWSGPPNNINHVGKGYLQDRGYWILTTEKRVKEFKRLWVEMWDKEDKPKARKIIEDFIKEYEYTYNVEDILEEYPTWGKTYKSYTMTICIKNLEPQIKTLLDLWEG